MALKKVRVQLLNEQTGAVLEEVDVATSATSVTFSDGETFQQKLDAGKLRGANGATGAQGPKGADGAIGPIGPKGENGSQGIQGPRGIDGTDGGGVKIGASLATATEGKLFFKVIG